MRATLKLLRCGVRLVLFSRGDCSLCETAKAVVSNVRKKNPGSDYVEIDVMGGGNEGWRNLYEFDTPVLHVQSAKDPVNHTTTSHVLKLMHRFSEDQVCDLIAQIED